jgi:hypothetical protein
MKKEEGGKNCIMRSSIGCTPPHIIRMIKLRIRWAGHLESMGEMRNAYKILVGQDEGDRSFGKPWRRLKDDIEKAL